jgi:hypothetical protein
MKIAFRIIGNTFFFALLTLLTQVGGLLWLLSLWTARFFPRKFQFWGYKSLVFMLLYAAASSWLIPPVAQRFGRVSLPIFANPHLKPEHFLFAALNRHYVRPALRQALEEVAQQMQTRYPGATIWYMDANFPFIDDYPLEPHFSHKDGKKVDLALYWKDARTQKPAAGTPSPFGYGVCAEPLPGEYDYNQVCEEKGYWYISLDKTLAEPFFDKNNWVFDAGKTRELGRLLAEHPSVGKILLQPHLEKRLHLDAYGKFRAQGCQAARHDDHFHVQL